LTGEIMCRHWKWACVAVGIALLSGCSTLFPEFASSPTTKIVTWAPRTVYVDGYKITEGEDTDRLNCWSCNDRVEGGRTLVEFGYFYTVTGTQVGFVLFDGGGRGYRGVILT
jgi:hypothetical protein